MFVELKVEGHSERNAAAITEALRAVPEVISAHIVSGSADFLLEVVVADLRDYERLLFDTLLNLPNVSDVRSNFALRAVKIPRSAAAVESQSRSLRSGWTETPRRARLTSLE